MISRLGYVQFRRELKQVFRNLNPLKFTIMIETSGFSKFTEIMELKLFFKICDYKEIR